MFALNAAMKKTDGRIHLKKKKDKSNSAWRSLTK